MNRWPLTRRDFLVRGATGLAGLTLAACAAEPRRVRPHIVLIVLDTVRQDHLSCYGYTRPTTPFLDSLAKTARLYRNAYSTTCWTFPAHASLFTGLYPVSHGVYFRHMRLEEELVTLAEALQAHGYQTAGFSENPFLTPELGFGQGFATYGNSKIMGRKPEDSLEAFRQGLDAKGDKPFFFFMNLFEAHMPYDSSRQFFKMFLTDETYANECSADLLEVIADGGKRLTPEWVTHFTEHYDAEIRYVDYLVEQMAKELQSRGMWDSTMCVVTADHGEHLGEHGLVEHQLSLYEPVVRVPLLIHYPDVFRPGSREDDCVQLTDLFPTLLDVAGIDPAPYPSEGRSLLPGSTASGRRVLCEYSFEMTPEELAAMANADPEQAKLLKDPRVMRYNRQLKALRVGNMKLIQGSDGSQELYDLRKDPGENHDLAADKKFAGARDDLVKALNEDLESYRAFHEVVPKPASPADQGGTAPLTALGYL